MKILMVIDTLRTGGRERRLMELIKGLKSNQISCELIILSERIEYKEFYSLEIPFITIKRKIKWDLSVFKRLYSYCKQSKPDVIHVWESMAAFYIVPVAKLLGIKVINGMIGDAPERLSSTSQKGILAKLTFHFSDAVVANSDAGLKSYSAPEKKSFCFHNGIDVNRSSILVSPEEVISSLGILHTNFIFGMVAGFINKKDYTTYIGAAIRLLDQGHDLTFLCIGHGYEMDMFKKSIPSEHINRIIFTGNQTNVEKVVNILNAGVLATFTEGISNAIMEYMLFEKPVIATDGGGTKELVIDKVTGFLVQQRSIEEMEEKMLTLFKNPELCRRMGAAGKKRIIEEFNLERMTDKYISLYSRLLNS